MTAPVSAVGFNLNSILTAAKAKPNGQQKAFYCSEVAGYIGANPDLVITVGGVVKYRAGISGSLESSSSGIELPTQFAEPPAVNTADALTSDDALVEIRSTVTTGRRLIVPLALLSEGDASKLAISAALNGSDAVRASVIVLAPPAGLDQEAASGNIIASVEQFIEQMTGASEGTNKNWSSSRWATQQAHIYVPGYGALADMTSGGRGDIITVGDGPDSIITWNWATTASGHNDSNNCLEACALEAWVLKNSFTGSWERMWGPSKLGGGYRWENDNTRTWVDAQDRASVSGAGVMCYPPEVDQYGEEFWPEGFNPSSHRNASLFAQSVTIHCRTLFRVRKRNPSGTDNRHLARYRVSLGFDVYNSKHYNYSGGTSPPFSRPEDGTYPGHAMDGGVCRKVIIPYNADNPDAWYAVGVTSLAGAYWTGGINNPWAAAMGVQPFTVDSPYAKAPWCMTAQQFRNNPPPMPTLS